VDVSLPQNIKAFGEACQTCDEAPVDTLLLGPDCARTEQATPRSHRHSLSTTRRNATEYFICENRQQTGRDAGLPDAGLAIWHVDELGNNRIEQMTPASHYELIRAGGQPVRPREAADTPRSVLNFPGALSAAWRAIRDVADDLIGLLAAAPARVAGGDSSRPG
jgi:hypothetical protein